MGWFYVAIAALEALLSVWGPWALQRFVLTDIPYFILLLVHILTGLRLLCRVSPPWGMQGMQGIPAERVRFRAEQLASPSYSPVLRLPDPQRIGPVRRQWLR